MVIGALGGVGTYDFWTQRLYLNFWYSSGSNSMHSFATIRRQLFAPIKAVLRKSICTSEPFLVILCDTLFLWSKLIFFTFESAATYRFLYMKLASLCRKMLLKLITDKSFNSEVTWCSFKYFPLLANFAAKLMCKITDHVQ